MTVLKYYNESTSQWEPLVIGAQGPTGPQGIQGIQGEPGADGEGVPVGGTTDQVLAKVDGTDYNTAWVDAGGGQTLLATYDLAGVGSVSLTNIPQTYRDLKIVITNFSGESGALAPLYIFLEDSTSTDIQLNYVDFKNDNVSSFTNLTHWRTGNDIWQSTGGIAKRNGVTMNVYEYALNTARGFNLSGHFYTDTGAQKPVGALGATETEPIHEVRVLYGGGNTFSSGTVEIYGLS